MAACSITDSRPELELELMLMTSAPLPAASTMAAALAIRSWTPGQGEVRIGRMRTPGAMPLPVPAITPATCVP
jgi:hypothetical protein